MYICTCISLPVCYTCDVLILCDDAISYVWDALPRSSLGVLGHLPPWAIPGVLVVYRRGSSSNSSSSTAIRRDCSSRELYGCCSRDAAAAGPLLRLHRNSGNTNVAAPFNAAAAALAAADGEDARDGDSNAHVVRHSRDRLADSPIVCVFICITTR